MTYFIAYITASFIFLSIDAIWLGVVAKNFMRDHLSHLLSEDVNFVVAAIFYLVYCVGIVFFAIKPALEQNNAMIAFCYGALFGFMCYATYEFTNLATLKQWPMQVLIVDIPWGTALTALAAVGGYYMAKKFGYK